MNRRREPEYEGGWAAVLIVVGCCIVFVVAISNIPEMMIK